MPAACSTGAGFLSRPARARHPAVDEPLWLRALNPMQILKRLAVAYVIVDGLFTQELNNSAHKKNLTEILKQLHEEKITIVPLVENATSPRRLQMGALYSGYLPASTAKSMLYEFNNDREM